MPFLQTERLIARPAAAGERLSGSFAGHVSLQGTTRKCSRCFRASCIRPCGAGSGPVVYPSLCRHAVRPSRIRSHRTYSLSGLISSLKVMTRDSDRACSLFRGKPSQKPLTIPVRKRYDRTDSLPESDSGIRGIRTHDNMPRLLLHCHDPLLLVIAKTEAVSSKRVHRQSSLPFADALLLRIPVLFGRKPTRLTARTAF